MCRYAQIGEEVLWRPAAQKMAFGVACRAILGDKFTEEDLEYMFPRVIAITGGMLGLVCFTCSLQHGVLCSNDPAGFVLSDLQDAAPQKSLIRIATVLRESIAKGEDWRSCTLSE